jgi:hypothetical protein
LLEETVNPGACMAGRFSKSSTRVVSWLVVLKKAIPGFVVVVSSEHPKGSAPQAPDDKRG